MIREALELIQATARQAQTPVELKMANDPRAVHLCIGGQISVINIPPSIRQHAVHSLADLIAYVRRLTRLYLPPVEDEEGTPYQREEEAGKGHPVIWHSPEGVCLIIDDEDRRDRVSFALTFSTEYELLRSFEENRSGMKQNVFVRTLKYTLGVPEPLVAPFRALNWTTAAAAVGEVTAGRDRMGREVDARVIASGGNALPETITLDIPIYNECAMRGRYEVPCNIELDVQQQNLLLIPAPHVLDDVLDQSQGDLHTRILDQLSGIAVYRGKP